MADRDIGQRRIDLLYEVWRSFDRVAQLGNLNDRTIRGNLRVCICVSDVHAWVLVEDLTTGSRETYGRWAKGFGVPGGPQAPYGGVMINFEWHMPWVTLRCVAVSEFTPTIELGYDGVDNNCASFAAAEWARITGEELTSENRLGIDDPATLMKSITQANESGHPTARR